MADIWGRFKARFFARSGTGMSREKGCQKRNYGLFAGIIWGADWAYFGESGVIYALIFRGRNRTVFGAYFSVKTGKSHGFIPGFAPGKKGETGLKTGFISSSQPYTATKRL